MIRPCVTTEHQAGACHLDGAELTEELLRENCELIAEIERLSAKGRRQFWLMTVSLAFAIGVAVISWSATP